MERKKILNVGYGKKRLYDLCKNGELSSRLLYGIIQTAGPALCNDTLFLEWSIKKHLCKTLVQNGVSIQPRVFKFTLSVLPFSAASKS